MLEESKAVELVSRSRRSPLYVPKK